MKEVSRSDWKLYKERIGKWQERYMEGLTKKYVEILTSNNKASDNFWKVEKLINKDKKYPGVVVELRCSKMMIDFAVLYRDGVISDSDLDGFSDEIIEEVKIMSKLVHSFE